MMHAQATDERSERGPAKTTDRRWQRPVRAALLLAPLLLAATGCWLEPFTRDVHPLDTGAPGRDVFTGEELEPGTTPEATPLPGPGELPTPVARGDEVPSVPLLGLLPGGLRAAVTKPGPEPNSDDQAWLQLTLRHRSSSGNRLVATHMLAWLVVETPIGDSPARSLRELVENRGGLVETEVDLATTRLRLRIPRSALQSVLRHLATAVATPPSSSSLATQARDRIVRRLTHDIADDPLTATIGRVREFELLGVSEWLSRGEDVTLADLVELHAQIYRSNGSLIALHTTRPSGRAGLRQLASALEPWTTAETNPTAEQVVTTPPAHGSYWAPGPGAPHGALVIDWPSPNQPDAVAWHLARECLTAGGPGGGRLARELADRLDSPPPLSQKWHDDGLRLRLELRFDSTAEDLNELRRALRTAWQSLTRQRPSLQELREASDRARLQLVRRWSDPNEWLRSATHLLASGARPEVLFSPDGLTDVPRDGPPPWQRLIQSLSNPDRLDTDELFASFDATTATLVAVGGREAGSDVEGFSNVPDALVPDARLAAVSASPTKQEQLAIDYLTLSVNAVGGPQRLLGATGYTGVAVVSSGRGPEMIDRIHFELAQSRVYRERQVMGTRIETTIDGATATEAVERRAIELTPSEASAVRAAARHHPSMLLRRFVTGEDRYRVISVRRVGDRDHAVLARQDDSTWRLRLHVDTGSGLIREVAWQTALDDQQFAMRVEHRDYRRAGGGVRVPHWQILRRDNDERGVQRHWQQFSHRLPPWPVGDGTAEADTGAGDR